MEDRLHKYATLIDSGSYTKAARKLHISQPALTTAMQKLERELHAELIVRGSRPLRCTEAGQVAYGTAKELAIHTANLTQQLSELAGRQAIARVGVIDSLADALIADGQAFQTLQAATNLNLTVHNSRQLLQALEQDELDIAFVVQQASHHSALLASQLIGNEPLDLVVHSSLEPIYKSALSQGIIPSFLSYNKGSTTEAIIRNALANEGIKPLVSLHSTSPGILLALAAQGQGAAVLPRRMVAAYIQQGTLMHLEQAPPLTRPILCAMRRGKRLAPPLQALQRTIQQLLY